MSETEPMTEITEEDVRRHLSVPAVSEDVLRGIAAAASLQGCAPEHLAYNAAVIATVIHETQRPTQETSALGESVESVGEQGEIVHRAMLRSLHRSMRTRGEIVP